MNIFLIVLSSLLSLPTFSALADLTPTELATLKDGKQLKKAFNPKDEIWPEVTVVTLIPNSPKENMAVFSDFESHTKFIPNLVKAKIIKKDGKVTDVAFEMDMPMPISNSVYSTRHVLDVKDETYKLSWNLIKANQMKSSKGSALFEPFEGKTLFTYNNHISPDSSFAGMFKDKARTDVEETVQIIIDHLAKTIK